MPNISLTLFSSAASTIKECRSPGSFEQQAINKGGSNAASLHDRRLRFAMPSISNRTGATGVFPVSTPIARYRWTRRKDSRASRMRSTLVSGLIMTNRQAMHVGMLQSFTISRWGAHFRLLTSEFGRLIHPRRSGQCKGVPGVDNGDTVGPAPRKNHGSSDAMVPPLHLAILQWALARSQLRQP